MGKGKGRMGIMETPSIRILNILMQRERERLQDLESAVEVDCHLMEFGDVRYHIQSSIADPQYVELSISLPSWPQESICSGGLPFGAIEAVKGAYGSSIEIIDPPEEGFQLTLAIDLAKFPLDKDCRLQLMKKIASLRAVVLGACMREILKNLTSRIVYPDAGQVITLVQHPKESFFLIPLMEKMMVVLPVHFKDSSDAVLAISFLQDFVEARRCSGLKKAPSCIWSQKPPQEMKGAPAYTSSANAGFLSFVIFRHHVEGDKLDRTVWTLSSFHAYLNYHIKRSKGFMHMLMRRRVDNLIQALNQAKVHVEKDKKKLKTPGSCVRTQMTIFCNAVQYLGLSSFWQYSVFGRKKYFLILYYSPWPRRNLHCDFKGS
ncbi:actin-related protein 2/3 complex subunit 2A isoform X2 [Cryptomeria japonica]|uniref:actin-related protein 2/3 complex subunit 2A isoform X2 n=1 Tax=Cryptomeria japonica TaxID=3369 RepID=UPI0025AD50EB|nr:actin-related protein 2/3 complex subunit 2A isoform X2 [Cryptomeria japonica]